ncbi:MAG: hypothetical protein VX202_04600 [Pseudomonadota bacterium]|nr:hypothetical protein [Pseudomonadota bacterium]
MYSEYEKHAIEDLGQKLAHLEGVLGAYLPQEVFDSEAQQKRLKCNKYSFSRMKSGIRRASNWELSNFVEMFDLARYGLDYRVFLLAMDAFNSELKDRGVGTYGATSAEQFREVLRAQIDPTAPITIHRDKTMNVGGIGYSDPDPKVVTLTARDRVALRVPLFPSPEPARYLLLLHDFPARRSTSCLMPSEYAPDEIGSGQTLTLPQHESGLLTFPVGGETGYRCMYGIQSSVDLGTYVGLKDPTNTVPEFTPAHMAALVDFLKNASEDLKAATHVTFGEYLLK